MFSSNQVFEVSGSLSMPDELEMALKFALDYSGEAKNMKQEEIDRGCKLLYQITEDGKYCIGWGYKEIPEGWSEYPFRFDVDIVSRIIKQNLETFQDKRGEFDVSYSKGFIMKCVDRCASPDKTGIKNPFYGIIYFKSYTCFYAQ